MYETFLTERCHRKAAALRAGTSSAGGEDGMGGQKERLRGSRGVSFCPEALSAEGAGPVASRLTKIGMQHHVCIQTSSDQKEVFLALLHCSPNDNARPGATATHSKGSNKTFDKYHYYYHGRVSLQSLTRV